MGRGYFLCTVQRSSLSWLGIKGRCDTPEMFSFFRKSQDPKKSPTQDKESDGFIFLGQTAAERQSSPALYPTSDLPYSLPYQMPPAIPPQLNRSDSAATKVTSQLTDGNPVMADLLNDIPFILAPHILEVQNICQELPEPVPAYNLDESFSRFHYDFTLENSVLCGL